MSAPNSPPATQKRGRQDDNEESDAKRVALGNGQHVEPKKEEGADEEDEKSEIPTVVNGNESAAAEPASDTNDSAPFIPFPGVVPQPHGLFEIVEDPANLKRIESTAGNDTVSTKNLPHHGASFFLRSKWSTRETSIVIGKNGTNIGRIREVSGAHITVSPYQRGVPERIATVSGELPKVAKAYGMFASALCGELDSPVKSESTAVNLLVPECLTLALLGYNSENMFRIQTETGVELHLAHMNMPFSTERALIIQGAPAVIEAAVYQLADSLQKEVLNRYGDVGMSNYAARDGAPITSTAVPGGLIAVPYWPRHIGGNWGRPGELRRATYAELQTPAPAAFAPQAGYNAPPQQPPFAAPAHEFNNFAQPGYAPQYPQQAYPAPYGAPMPADPNAFAYQQPGMPARPPQQGTMQQQIFIPNDMVGAVIGKGGHKINEIRTQSEAAIKISEPAEGRTDRLVTITGTQQQNQIALALLQQRIDSEKHRN